MVLFKPGNLHTDPSRSEIQSDENGFLVEIDKNGMQLKQALNHLHYEVKEKKDHKRHYQMNRGESKAFGTGSYMAALLRILLKQALKHGTKKPMPFLSSLPLSLLFVMMYV